MNRRVVSDAGPIIHLDQSDALYLLNLAGDVLIPQTVMEELQNGSADVSELAFTVEEVDYEELTYPQLDSGETAALVLCRKRDAVLLTDDLDARTTAKEEGIEVHGTIGIVLFAFNRGELSGEDTKRLLRSLERDTNLYLSDPLIEYAIELVETDDAGW